jgi:hypothetical protein
MFEVINEYLLDTIKYSNIGHMIIYRSVQNYYLFKKIHPYIKTSFKKVLYSTKDFFIKEIDNIQKHKLVKPPHFDFRKILTFDTIHTKKEFTFKLLYQNIIDFDKKDISQVAITTHNLKDFCLKWDKRPNQIELLAIYIDNVINLVDIDKIADNDNEEIKKYTDLFNTAFKDYQINNNEFNKHIEILVKACNNIIKKEENIKQYWEAKHEIYNNEYFDKLIEINKNENLKYKEHLLRVEEELKGNPIQLFNSHLRPAHIIEADKQFITLY